MAAGTPTKGLPSPTTTASTTASIGQGGPTVVYDDKLGTMTIRSTLVGPPPTPPGQICPCNPITGEPLGGSGLPGADVYGHVRDGAGHPIPNVCITLAYVTEVIAQVKTDATGAWHYKFPGLGAHPVLWFTYTDCTGANPGWAFPPAFFTNYSFNSGLTITIEAQVQPAAAVAGVAVDDLGHPIPGAQVKLYDGYAPPQSALADATGHFSFTHLDSIPMTLDGNAVVAGGPYLMGAVKLQLSPGVTSMITLVLSPI